MNTYKRLLITIGFIILILTGCTNNTQMTISPKFKSGEKITFFVTNDIHYLAEGLRDEGEAFQKFFIDGDGKQLNYIDEILEAFINDIEQKKPEILIISGDLTNNGEKQSHIELAEKLNKIEEMGISVYVIPGNHDILNPWALGFKDNKRYFVDTITDKDFSKIYNNFGYNEAISKDKHTLSYLAAPSEDTWLLMLDTNKYSDNQKYGQPQTDGMIKDETFEWIQECSELAKENDAKIITVMHHNLLDHSKIIRAGFTINNNKEVLEKFSDLGLNLALSGHVHIQDISSYEKISKSNVSEKFFDIATSSLSVYPQQYGILDYSPELNSYNYSTAFVDVEGWSKEKGILDKNLNEFKKYSYTFFADKGYDMAYKFLKEDKNYDDRQKNLMAETFKKVNVKYFEGTDNNTQEIINSEGFKLWEEAKPSFIKSYIMSIYSDEDIDDNNFLIKQVFH
ncbi:metallophosphoesterase [Clostridium ganghwense]|uniref:Metallophosphoesterase n=1 Tax=Clostridium ganghwense TaxID=312089 RepID=A0ABT4CTI2_9CLOT|nr:metallophosphoesterase [Clostridium ganghwense]MCY6372228.1 metallophosphoesterase [Clostridium ganghwense]